VSAYSYILDAKWGGGIVGWIAAGVLGLIALLFITLYRKSLNEGRHLRNYALLILLDQSVYNAQRQGLSALVRSLDAKNAGDLGLKVNLALDQLAERLGGTLLSVAGLLWKLKNSPAQ
jgi:hypothetical protein